VQAATKIVIEPIFEADMLECSFGFGPKRSTHDALQVLIDEAWRADGGSPSRTSRIVLGDSPLGVGGPPPWHLYRFILEQAFGVATVEPYGASRWRFGPHW
jgi:hypothetical protein